MRLSCFFSQSSSHWSVHTSTDNPRLYSSPFPQNSVYLTFFILFALWGAGWVCVGGVVRLMIQSLALIILCPRNGDPWIMVAGFLSNPLPKDILQMLSVWLPVACRVQLWVVSSVITVCLLWTFSFERSFWADKLHICLRFCKSFTVLSCLSIIDNRRN